MSIFYPNFHLSIKSTIQGLAVLTIALVLHAFRVVLPYMLFFSGMYKNAVLKFKKFKKILNNQIFFYIFFIWTFLQRFPHYVLKKSPVGFSLWRINTTEHNIVKVLNRVIWNNFRHSVKLIFSDSIRMWSGCKW